MDSNRYVRSRTSSTSSLPATPAHTPNTSSSLPRAGHGVFPAFQQFSGFSVSPDLLAANLSRVRAEQGCRASSIPPTPAPTPNLVVQHFMIPEQLEAGIKNLRVDEGYIESSSVPATPAPTPFLPSPAQFSGYTPDQIAEGIRRLREDDAVSGLSEASTGQPPTPSSTPGPVGLNQVIVPERLAESIQHLRCDEGLESTSNPGTPVPTPISPLLSQQGTRSHQVLPEQLAAGIHRLKVEEGMSSGGSSGFPSTPAPTPFTYHPGGVRPEDLAAGISRLSVIEETEVHPQPLQQQQVSIRVVSDDASGDSQPNLSQYFSDAQNSSAVPSTPGSFFDQLSASQTTSNEQPEESSLAAEDEQTAVLHSCRESRIDLTTMGSTTGVKKEEAELPVVEQVYDDARSLQRRQSQDGESLRRHHHSSAHDPENLRLTIQEPTVQVSTSVDGSSSPHVCKIFSKSNVEDPFDTILSNQDADIKTPEPIRADPPNTLTMEPVISVSNATPKSQTESLYATPVAPTPTGNSLFAYSTSTPLAEQRGGSSGLTSFHSSAPITSPLPSGVSPVVALPPSISNLHESLEARDDEKLSPEALRRRDAWIPSPATLKAIELSRSSQSVDQTLRTRPVLQFRENLQDPVTNLIAHYRGESESGKRQVLTADSVSQDERGIRQLIDEGCYRAAINLTSRLLQQSQQQGQLGSSIVHSPYTIQLWYTRLSLLLKLKQYSNAEIESESFNDLDRPDLYFDFYPDIYPNRKGSMVPFEFRILLAEMPHFLGKHHDALDRLNVLLATVDRMIENLKSDKSEDGRNVTLSTEDRNESIEFWARRRVRIIYSLANCAISQKDFELAVTTLEMIFNSEKIENRPKIKSALGRVFLQLGDLISASVEFEEAKSLRLKLSSKLSNEMECDNLLDAGFFSIASNNYAEALSHFESANNLCPGNPVIVTNKSVCLLYLGRLKDAIASLESQLTANPKLFLQETPVLNLATLYELESSFAGQKKLALLDLMGQFAGDGVNTSCLKF